MSDGFDAAAANLLMDQHGWSAVSVAAHNVCERRAAGDEVGEAVWLSIMDTILEIGRTYRGANIDSYVLEEAPT